MNLKTISVNLGPGLWIH